MRILPISLTEPALARVRGLRQSVIRRPGELLARCRAGDRLWVREPFHLPAAFDGFSPSQAAERGAKIAYAIDGTPDGFGRRRFARTLPRDCHRMHLVLTEVTTGQLQDITDLEIQRDHGLVDRVAFVANWNAAERAHARSIAGTPISWADNPRVTILRFQPVFAPIANIDFANREKAAA